MKNIAIFILAREGSKRIPGKNFKKFNDKPLIHWTLEGAEKLDYPVYFYSDSREMRNYARGFNVTVREKPEEFAQDNHKTNEELLYYNNTIEAEILVLLQPTSPIRDWELIKRWIVDFDHKNFNCGMSVYKLPLKFFYIGNNPINFDDKERDFNGCHKDALYTENGSFYIFKKEMLNCKHFIQRPYQMYSDKFGVELDYLWQWENAELLHRRIQNEN